MEGPIVSIRAKTFFGARHAFATLVQLITKQTIDGKTLMRTGITITDKVSYDGHAKYSQKHFFFFSTMT